VLIKVTPKNDLRKEGTLRMVFRGTESGEGGLRRDVKNFKAGSAAH